MITYLITIISSFIVIVATNLIFTELTFSECFGATFFGVLVMVLIDAVVAIFIHEIPKLFFKNFMTKTVFYNHNHFPFKTFKFERKFYEFIGIRKWKDLLPNKMGMNKQHIKDKSDVEYLNMFLIEGCRAETLHILSAIISVVFIFRFPFKYLSITIPVTVVNVVLQILPVFVQRYNRPKINMLLKRNQKMLKIQQEQQKCSV